VRSSRGQKNNVFIDLNDGSSAKNLQVITTPAAIPDRAGLSTGAYVEIVGQVCTSPKPGQSVELVASRVNVIGSCPPTFPLQKKSHSLEFLREIAHLRSRSGAYSAAIRIRHQVSQAIHKFFSQRDFVLVNTPILTSNDCEGAGELFAVAPRVDAGPAVQTQSSVAAVKKNSQFFGREAYLTVSGQLQLEAFALGLGRAYTLGPTFRAENSNTMRHAAEFWMLEAEEAPGSMDDAVSRATHSVAYLRTCSRKLQCAGSNTAP
jgi:asparaginyl-tRNA synthetase